MKISVVIPLYNKGPYVKRALLSVLAQTFPDFEVIVVDDGSTDESMQIVKNIHDFRVKLIQQENAGVSAARNRGIQEAKADLIAFLDADDEWAPDYLKTIINLQKRFPEAGAYATAYKIHSRGKVHIPKHANIPPPPWEGLIPNYFKSARRSCPVWTSAVVIPRRVFPLVGYFPVGMRRGQDRAMWFKVALKYKIAFSHYPGAIYHLDTEKKINIYSPSGLTWGEVLIQTYINEINKQEIPENLSADVKEYISWAQIHVAYGYLLRGKPGKSREILLNTRPKNIGGCFRKYWWFFWSVVPVRFFYFAQSLKRKHRRFFFMAE